jgi:hypothetical protein
VFDFVRFSIRSSQVEHDLEGRVITTRGKEGGRGDELATTITICSPSEGCKEPHVLIRFFMNCKKERRKL